MNNYVDSNKGMEMVEIGNKNIYSLLSILSEEKILLYRAKNLCIKLQNYDGKFVLDSNQVDKMNRCIWQINGYKDILNSLDKMSDEFAKIEDKIELLCGVMSHLKDSFEQIDQYMANMVNSFTDYEKVPSYKDGVGDVSQEDVMHSIQINFQRNRDFNQEFSQDVYRKVYDDILKLNEEDNVNVSK